MKSNNIKLKHNLMTDMLEELWNLRDLEIYCKDGTFSCSGIFFTTMFPSLRIVLETVHQQEDCPALSIPDVGVRDLEQLLSSVCTKQEVISPAPSIHFLLKNYDQGRTQTKVDCVKSYLDEDMVKSEIIDDVEDDYDGVDNFDAIEPVKIEIKSVSKKPQKSTKVKKAKQLKVTDEDYDYDPHLADDKYGNIEKKPPRTLQYPILRFDYTDISCQICDLTWTSEQAMFNHVFYNHGPQPQSNCPECDSIFVTHKELKKHMQTEHEEKSPCTECGKLLTKQQMKTHVLSHIEVKEVECSECSKLFKSKFHLESHFMKVHGDASGKKWKNGMRMSDWAERCDKVCNCGLVFRTGTEQKEHYKLVHQGCIKCSKCDKILSASRIDSHKCVPGRKRYELPCPICGKVFLTHGGLKYHNENVHGDAKFSCEICGKIFTSESLCKQHVDRFHKELTACTICGAVVKYMKLHMRTVHTSDSEKNFNCEFCGKGFQASGKLEKHRMNMHLKLRPHVCRYGCGVAYNDHSNRNQHEKKKHGALFSQK